MQPEPGIVFVFLYFSTDRYDDLKNGNHVYLVTLEPIRILHGCEVRIEISVPGIQVDPEGRNFLSAPNTHV